MRTSVVSLAAVLTAPVLLWSAPALAQRNDSVGALPQMGWNSYNAYGCAPNETKVRANLNALKSNDLISLGYSLFQVDCGWQASFRNASNGAISIVTDRFPNGFQKLANDVRAAGMSWGMYTDEGELSCDTDPSRGAIGSLGHEAADAAFFKSLGTVTVKVDNCFVDGRNNAPKTPSSDFVTRYSVMSRALTAQGIGGMEVCQWGVPYSSSSGLQGPAQWTANLSTSFRLSDDISNDWVSVVRISNQAMNIVNKGLSGPRSYADADLLEIGNNVLTFEEQKTHFTLWAALKSPLMISTDLSTASQNTLTILKNTDVIALNQDTRGEPVKLVQRYSNAYDLYQGTLANGDRIVLLIEQGNQVRSYTINFTQFGISTANMYELWSKQRRTSVSSFAGTVLPHGVIALRLSNIVVSGAVAPTLTYYEAEAATLSAGAVAQACAGCSGGKNVGYVGTLTFNNVASKGTTQTVFFDYVNANISYLGTNSTSAIGANVRVNGGSPQEVLFPLSGYNWGEDVWQGFKVDLSGFKPGTSNTLAISGGHYLSRYAPDIDRIGIVA
ncbi:alfa-D-galactopyranosidase/beta-L arabinopyranosidase [Microstroma glucosiphilum]|uniref:Alpha-galactosidase n=1 Tax=Pseudomicrostroma glucosiphilum TaxID=1684307 RepID=A0A316TZV7_9BASI|nr:alfa-D-galactopyranosidase/beta-L arabinopyranosidase [Pseudomicrostroma glucosiphilum]PWN18702.1 alfa-D-galactopyranosidase/beta-L arabinopyranosidase [Pseudomicrostroma glucosiphilum]